ncbi:hypothetical protein DPMN_121477 [Dreissena polymorpha]|uniref:Uncharacterized protein n=3 Tax=Dreissena polymorpha TaxID=45954 RepID=A0A9D4GQK5_DREPO|nr:hypothetical protein DPMN_121477 [Dreissena polymorpha]
MLSQGLEEGMPRMTAENPLLPAVKFPSTLQVGDINPYNFSSLPNTSGSVQPKKRKLKTTISQSVPTPILPSVPTPILPSPIKPPLIIPIASNIMPVSLQPAMHRQTQRYRQIKIKEEAEGKVCISYHKIKPVRNCKKCGEIISIDTHVNLWGSLYCPKTAKETLEEFKKRRYLERFPDKNT